MQNPLLKMVLTPFLVHRRNQFHQYTTLLPGMSRLLDGVQDRSVWDHKTGEWKTTTHSAIQEAKNRRDWVCAELERIDTLRYEVMADWKQKTEEGYLADRNKDDDKKRKRDQESEVTTSPTSPRGEESDEEHDDTRTFKSPRTTVDASIEPTAKKPRPSIEPPFDFPPPEPQIPDSQTTLPSLSTSPDLEHDTRSPAPEPESPVKAFMPSSDNKESIRRYAFVLDIPTTDNQRVEWLKFLDKHHWNPAMISSLRRFFCADPSPNTSMTKRFLERLWEVAGGVEAVDEEGVAPEQGQGEGKGREDKEKHHRLFWDRKVKVLVDEVAALATPVRGDDVGGNERVLPTQQKQPQPTWLKPPSVSPVSSVGMPTPKRSGSSTLTVSPSDGRVRALGLPVAGLERRRGLDTASDSDADGRRGQKLDIPALMKQYVATLSQGDRVDVPCDKCRALSLECHINRSSCRRCARRHDRCVWNEVKVGEVRALGLLGEEKREGERGIEGEVEMDGDEDEDEEEVQKSRRKRGRGSGNPTKPLRSSGGQFAFTGGRGARRKSVYDFLEDGDETMGFLEDNERDGGNGTGENEDARAMDDGDETRVFLDRGREGQGDNGGAIDVDSTDEEADEEMEEEEWVPSS